MYTKLKTLRKQHHLTAQRSADMLGISKPFYCQIENGLRRLSYDLAVRISQIYGMRPDEIFYDDQKHKAGGKK